MDNLHTTIGLFYSKVPKNQTLYLVGTGWCRKLSPVDSPAQH